jgi:hypothetical protein
MADLSTTLPLTRESVAEAHKLIRAHVHRTPVLTNGTLTELASTARSEEELRGTRWEGRRPARPVLRLWFKCENLQRVGAFKARGAFHAVERLKMEPGWLEGGGKEKGVVTHSSGTMTKVSSFSSHHLGGFCNVSDGEMLLTRQPRPGARPRGPRERHRGAHCHARDFDPAEDCGDARLRRPRRL